MAKLTGQQRLQQDPRSTTELIESALADPENRTGIAVLHARGTRDILDIALALCAAPTANERATGAAILGELGSPRTFPEECCDALLDLIKRDQDADVLTAAVFALAHLGNRRCEPDLIDLRHHENKHIRHGVALALCGTTAPASVKALLELMEDPYEMVRDWATTGIGQTVSLDTPEIREALLRRAEDSDEMTRAEALHGLARRHDKRVVPYLIKELRSNQEKEHLFCDAAKTYLDVKEDDNVDKQALLEALASM